MSVELRRPLKTVNDNDSIDMENTGSLSRTGSEVSFGRDSIRSTTSLQFLTPEASLTLPRSEELTVNLYETINYHTDPSFSRTKSKTVGAGNGSQKTSNGAEENDVKTSVLQTKLNSVGDGKKTAGAFQIKSSAPLNGAEMIMSPTMRDEEFKASLDNSLTRRGTKSGADTDSVRSLTLSEKSSANKNSFAAGGTLNNSLMTSQVKNVSVTSSPASLRAVLKKDGAMQAFANEMSDNEEKSGKLRVGTVGESISLSETPEGRGRVAESYKAETSTNKQKTVPFYENVQINESQPQTVSSIKRSLSRSASSVSATSADDEQLAVKRAATDEGQMEVSSPTAAAPQDVIVQGTVSRLAKDFNKTVPLSGPSSASSTLERKQNTTTIHVRGQASPARQDGVKTELTGNAGSMGMNDEAAGRVLINGHHRKSSVSSVSSNDDDGLSNTIRRAPVNTNLEFKTRNSGDEGMNGSEVGKQGERRMSQNSLRKLERQDSESTAAEELAAARARLRKTSNSSSVSTHSESKVGDSVQVNTSVSNRRPGDDGGPLTTEEEDGDRLGGRRKPGRDAELLEILAQALIDGEAAVGDRNDLRTPTNEEETDGEIRDQLHTPTNEIGRSDAVDDLFAVTMGSKESLADRVPSVAGGRRGPNDTPLGSQNSSFSASHHSGDGYSRDGSDDHDSSDAGSDSRRLIGAGREKMRRTPQPTSLTVDVAGPYTTTSSSNSTPSEKYEPLAAWQRRPKTRDNDSDSTMTGDSDQYEGRQIKITGRDKIRRTQSQEDEEGMRGGYAPLQGELRGTALAAIQREPGGRAVAHGEHLPYQGRDAQFSGRQRMRRDDQSGSEQDLYSSDGGSSYGDGKQDRSRSTGKLGLGLIDRDYGNGKQVNTEYGNLGENENSYDRPNRENRSSGEHFYDRPINENERGLGTSRKPGQEYYYERPGSENEQNYADPSFYDDSPDRAAANRSGATRQRADNNSPDVRVISADGRIISSHQPMTGSGQRQPDSAVRSPANARGAPYVSHVDVDSESDDMSIYSSDGDRNGRPYRPRGSGQSDSRLNRPDTLNNYDEQDYPRGGPGNNNQPDSLSTNDEPDYQRGRPRNKNNPLNNYDEPDYRGRARDTRNGRPVDPDNLDYESVEDLRRGSPRKTSNNVNRGPGRNGSGFYDDPELSEDSDYRSARLLNANLTSSHRSVQTVTDTTSAVLSNPRIVGSTGRSTSTVAGYVSVDNNTADRGATPVAGIINIVTPQRPITPGGVLTVTTPTAQPDIRIISRGPTPCVGMVNVSQRVISPSFPSPAPNGYDAFQTSGRASATRTLSPEPESLTAAAIDPELKQAEKTGQNYHITMNVKAGLIPSRPPSRGGSITPGLRPNSSMAMRSNSYALQLNSVPPGEGSVFGDDQQDPGQYVSTLSVVNPHTSPRVASITPQYAGSRSVLLTSPSPSQQQRSISRMTDRSASRGADSDVGFNLQLVNLPQPAVDPSSTIVLQREDPDDVRDKYVVASVSQSDFGLSSSAVATTVEQRFKLGNITSAQPPKEVLQDDRRSRPAQRETERHATSRSATRPMNDREPESNVTRDDNAGRHRPKHNTPNTSMRQTPTFDEPSIVDEPDNRSGRPREYDDPQADFEPDNRAGRRRENNKPSPDKKPSQDSAEKPRVYTPNEERHPYVALGSEQQIPVQSSRPDQNYLELERQLNTPDNSGRPKRQMAAPDQSYTDLAQELDLLDVPDDRAGRPRRFVAQEPDTEVYRAVTPERSYRPMDRATPEELMSMPEQTMRMSVPDRPLQLDRQSRSPFDYEYVGERYPTPLVSKSPAPSYRNTPPAVVSDRGAAYEPQNRWQSIDSLDSASITHGSEGKRSPGRQIRMPDDSVDGNQSRLSNYMSIRDDAARRGTPIERGTESPAYVRRPSKDGIFDENNNDSWGRKEEIRIQQSGLGNSRPVGNKFQPEGAMMPRFTDTKFVDIADEYGNSLDRKMDGKTARVHEFMTRTTVVKNEKGPTTQRAPGVVLPYPDSDFDTEVEVNRDFNVFQRKRDTSDVKTRPLSPARRPNDPPPITSLTRLDVRSLYTNTTTQSVKHSIKVDRLEDEILDTLPPGCTPHGGDIPSSPLGDGTHLDYGRVVDEQVDMSVVDGKAVLTARVRSEKIVPILGTEEMFKKSSVIVTKFIEVDLTVTQQRKSLYDLIVRRQNGEGGGEGVGLGGFTGFSGKQQQTTKGLSKDETAELYRVFTELAELKKNAQD